MNWTFEDYKRVRLDKGGIIAPKKHHYEDYNFFYAKALEDMEKRTNYHEEKEYIAKCMRSGETFWVYRNNCRDDVAKNEIFICGQSDHSFGVEKATGVFSFQRPKKLSTKSKIRQYLTKKRFKRERKVYEWYDGEISQIEEKYWAIARERQDKLCDINLKKEEIKEKPSSVYMATRKGIKTEFGIESDAYINDFNSDESIDLGLIRTKAQLNKFKNHGDFKKAQLPLYHVKRNGLHYLFEASDIKLQEAECSQMGDSEEIAIIDEWEDAMIELDNKRRKLRRWLNKCISKIKDDVYSTYPHLKPKY